MILQSARLSVEMEAPGANWEKDDDNQEVGLEGAILGGYILFDLGAWEDCPVGLENH